jgi:hypothetical protein
MSASDISSRFRSEFPGGIVHANEFVELQVNRLGISALRALDQEDHEERDNRGSRIDYQLPGV